MTDEHRDTHADEQHDDWFRHTPDEPTAQHAHGEVQPFFILGFLAAVIIVTFAVIGLFLVYFGRTQTDLYGERNERATDRFLAAEKNEAQANWNESLNKRPEWQDMEAGHVSLPIKRARRAVIDRYNAGQWPAPEPSGQELNQQPGQNPRQADGQSTN